MTLVVHDASLARAPRDTSGTVHLWFAPDVGWRVELDNGMGRTIYERDGTQLWGYDPQTNHYTVQPFPAHLNDPRCAIFLGGELGPCGARDVQTILTALRSNPDSLVTQQGTVRVAGRVTQRVLVMPSVCSTSTSSRLSPAGIQTGTPTTTCQRQGTYRLWLDTATGWLLRSEVDDGRGVHYSVNTSHVVFNVPMDVAQFQFTPPPGSTQVQSLP